MSYKGKQVVFVETSKRLEIVQKEKVISLRKGGPMVNRSHTGQSRSWRSGVDKGQGVPIKTSWLRKYGWCLCAQTKPCKNS